MRGGIVTGGDKDTRFGDGNSRWGVKGSNELSEGLTAVYRFEHQFSTENGELERTDNLLGGKKGRLGFVGLSGGFGTVSLGTVWSASFNGTGAITDNSLLWGNSHTGYIVDSALSYAHSVGDVSFQVDAVMDPATDSGNAIDQAHFGLSFSLGDIGKIAVSHVTAEDYTTHAKMAVDLTGNAGGTGETAERTANEVSLNSETGVITNSEKIVWRNKKTGEVVDPATAKDVMITYTVTVSGVTHTVKPVMVYHNAGDTVPTTGELMVVGDNYYASEACDTAAEREAAGACDDSHWVWVESVPGSATKSDTDKDLKMMHTIRTPAAAENLMYTATGKPAMMNYGSKSNHIAAEFGFGAVTAYVGYSQEESNKAGAKKDKITHYGLRGSIGDSGIGFLVQAKSQDLEGSKPKDAERTPYLVQLTKGLGEGATAFMEHATDDAKGEEAKTWVGLKVDF